MMRLTHVGGPTALIGFALRSGGQEDGVLWISGDTVPFAGLDEVVELSR